MTKHRDDGVPMSKNGIYQGDVAARRPNQVKGQQRMLLEHLAKHPGAGWQDIAARYGWTTATAQRVCRRALAEGLIAGDLASMRCFDAE